VGLAKGNDEMFDSGGENFVEFGGQSSTIVRLGAIQ